MLTYLKLMMTALFWGGTFIAGRMLAADVKPFSAAFLRFLVATLLLYGVTLRQEGRIPRVDKGLWLPLALLGLTGVFAYNVCFFKGLQLVPAGRASIIIANNPIVISLFSALLFKEALTPLKVVGILLSVAGAVTAICGGSPAALLAGGIGLGDLFIFGCVLSWSAYSLIGKRVMGRLSPLGAVFYSAAVGMVALFIPACMEGMPVAMVHYSWANWCSLIYLGLFGTVLGFVWYYEGIRKIGPSRASLFINFVPISGIVLAAIILKEPVTPSLFIGLVLVLSGVFLTNLPVSGVHFKSAGRKMDPTRRSAP